LIVTLVPAVLAQKPVISTGGVKNAASLATPLTAIAPQMLVSLFGQNLAGATAVSFNGISAPLLYVSPTQINTQVPSAIAGSASAAVVVTTPADSSDPVSVPAGNRALGTFAQGAAGCGQVAAFNIHADGSTTVNSPQNSFDPEADAGLAIFATGLGAFPGRMDGVPWQFNPADNLMTNIGVSLGIPGVNSYGSPYFSVDYAGPAPTLVGVDQVNAILDPVAAPQIPQGCKIPLSLTDFFSSASQFTNVSIHKSGGACVDPPADELANVTWQRNGVAIQFLQGPGLGFAPAPTVNHIFTGAALTPQPSFCAASYPTTLSVGAVTLSGPGLGSMTLQPQNQNGVTVYQGTAPISGGSYQVSVGATSAAAQIPAPITMTTNLTPGTKVSSTLALDWTGGDSASVVTAEFIVRGAIAFDYTQTVPAAQGHFQFPGVTPVQFSPGMPFPQGDVEIRVTQQPAVSRPNPFSMPGVSLGGQQTWNYVFDYAGLTNQ